MVWACSEEQEFMHAVDHASGMAMMETPDDNNDRVLNCLNPRLNAVRRGGSDLELLEYQ